MKRWTSLVLTALLLLGLSVPALAEPAPAATESADARLARVTQSVKETLDLDTEQYGEFWGDVYEEELGSVWDLYWSGNGTTLNVEALDDGTVVGYWRNASTPSSYGWTLPTLPKTDAAAAKRAAQAFLDRVLDKAGESVKLETPKNTGQLSLGSTSTRFSGNILLNGLPSPLTWSISVDSDNAVTSFYRDAAATTFIGGVPSASPAVTKAGAGAKLKDTLKLELIYVTSEDDASKAVLRYVPAGYETQYVDAQTGELVAPSEEAFFFNGASGSASMDTTAAEAEDGGSRKQLTEAELSGAAKLEGVLDRDALDKAVRAESAYQLDKLKLSLSSANYYIVKEGADGQEETVLCTLRYASAENDYASSRTFTVDARTGAVRSLYGGGRWDKEKKSAVNLSAAQKTAEDFLKRFTSHANVLELYKTEDDTADGAPSYAFRFARKVNGYFYPENSCTVRVDRMTGAVCGVDFTYDEAVKFDVATGLISAGAALDAWFGTYDVTLGYRYLSKELSAADPREAKLIATGWTRFRALFLSYGLEREDYCPGIDAKSGKPVVNVAEADNALAYGDTAGHWAEKEIETLADYGVGYAGGSFGPDKALTQWEFVCLLASTRNGRYDPENATAEERDNAYNTVYRMGALTPDERSDGAAVERMELVRVLLNGAGYGSVARLKGIYACSYADAASIPSEHLGYAALAQGFGLVSGEYNAHARATRAVAAVMLCRLMGRDA